jgi:hypothetical protein
MEERGKEGTHMFPVVVLVYTPVLQKFLQMRLIQFVSLKP